MSNRMSKQSISTLGVLVFLTSFALSNSGSEPQSEHAMHGSGSQGGEVSENTLRSSLTTDAIANATYDGIYDDPVTLTDGHWEGAPFVEGGASRPSVGLLEDFCLAGDLDADGSTEAIVLLWENSGGSGTRSYLAVMGEQYGKIKNVATALIGDRVQIRSGRLAGPRIELDVVQQGPSDAACCPSQKATRAWTLGANGLAEETVQITGTLSLADLENTEWVLTSLGREDPVPVEPEITLTLNNENFVGISACNRYFVEPQEGPTPGQLTLGPIGATQMACPQEIMDMEGRYLDALAKVTMYSFQFNKLLLTWQQDGVIGTMVFKGRKQPPKP